MSSNRSVSIIFITHNRKEELFRALESCFIQTWKNVDYIIVDNASNKNISNEVKEKFTEFNPKIKYQYIYSEENLGVAEGRNYAFSFSNADYSFFLDDDAILVSKNSIERIVNDFEMNEKIAAIACNIYQPIDNTYLLGFQSRVDKTEMLSYIGAAHAIRNNIWENRKLYPSEMKFGSEELYIGLFIHKNNFKLYYDNEIIVHHLPSIINRKKGKERKLDIILNIYIIRKYYYPRIVLIILFLALIIHLLKNGIFDIVLIRKKLTKRNNKEYIDRMSLGKFKDLTKKYGVMNLF